VVLELLRASVRELHRLDPLLTADEAVAGRKDDGDPEEDLQRSGHVHGLLSTARGREDERVRHDDDAATEGLRELPATNGLDGAVLDAGVTHRRVLQNRRDDLPRRRDGELHHDAAAEVRLLRQLLLVAVLHLVDVTPDDAADDFLVERTANVRLTGDDVRRLGATTTESTGAAAVARAVATATTLADGAEVTEADGAFTGTTAARTGADQAETPDAVGLADLVADQTAKAVSRAV